MSSSAFSPPDSDADEIGLHRGMLDDFPTMVWAADLEGSFTYLNRAWVQFTGHEPADPAGGWLDQIHPDDRAGTQQQYFSAVRRRRSFELQYRLLRHDGVYRWVVDRGNPTRDASGHCTGFIGFCYDATEGREADDARHEVEEQVRLLSQATRDMIWSWDSRSGRVVHNAAFAEALGPMPAPYGDTLTWWKERVHEEDRERVVGAFRKAVRQGDPDVTYQYRFCRRDGTYAFIDDRVCFVRDDAGQVERVVSAMRDITQRRLAEEAQHRFARILGATSDVVGMASPDGRLIYLNDAGRKLLGLEPNGRLNDWRIEALHPEWANEIIRHEGIPTALAEGRWAGETALIGLDGREIPVSQVILSHPNPRGVVEFLSTIIRDISDRKREEVARIEWANRYDAAIRASGQLLFDWNSHTNDVTYAGDIQRFLGYSAAEMAGGLSRFRELIHRDDIAAFDQEVSRVIATRDPARLQFRIIRGDGVEAMIDVKGYFFLDREGRIGRMVGFFADITQQQRAEVAVTQAHDLLEARVEQRSVELERTYSLIQDRALQQGTVAQLGQRALAGAPLAELFAEATAVVRETLKTDLCAALELEPGEEFFAVRGLAGWPVEARDLRIPTGMRSFAGYTLLAREPVIVADMDTETRFEVTPVIRQLGVKSGVGVLIQAGSQPIGVLCTQSLRHRKFTQDDVHYLQSIANVLTAAITRQQAEQSLRAAQQQAEAANRAKSEFLSRMSHELRTPLNAILGFTQLLEIDSPTPTQAESVTHITHAGEHLLKLINEVLDIARIEAGRLVLNSEEVEIGGFLRQMVELIQPTADRQGIKIFIDASCDLEASITADRQRLQQVLLNLLSNAVKYNRPAGRITLSCLLKADSVRISVADTGMGLPEEKLARLFVPFERLGAEATGVEGTGIGLALTQRIVTALKGKIGVESALGEGSTFWVEFPLAAAMPHTKPADQALEETPPPAEPEATEAVRTVLYIEDQDLNLRLVERILMRRKDYKLISAMQGGLALELARESRPDIILLDLNLPDMSGEEVLRRLKSDPVLRGIPVIMVSADAIGERIDQLLQLGATSYLTKPYKVADLISRLDAVGRGKGS